MKFKSSERIGHDRPANKKVNQTGSLNGGKTRGGLHVVFAALLSLPFPVHALTPQTLLFEQHFESLNEIQQAGGSCLTGGTDCSASVFVPGTTGNALEFKKSGFPTVWFPVANNGNPHIDPLKGTVMFDYVPLGAPDGDWDSPPQTQKIFFQLRDPNAPISIDRTLRIGTFYSATSMKHYLYFRYDGTSGCSDVYPPPDGTLYCQRETSTSPAEPGLIMQWQPNSSHKIVASWDFTGQSPYLLLFVDDYARAAYYGTTVGLDGFNPTGFYVGSLAGSYSAQGSMDNLQIYSDVVLDPSNPVQGYIEKTRDDGVWQPHETVNDTTDAPAPLDLAGEPFIFYPSSRFEAVYEGSVPIVPNDPSELIVHVAKNQIDTSFFNIYAGNADPGLVTVSVSNLIKGSSVLDQSKIKIRTVKNWWQSSKEVRQEVIPVYVPELLVYDDTKTLACTGTAIPGRPCADAQFPSDPPMPYTRSQVQAHTSRQFALTLDIPADIDAGEYLGSITVATENAGSKILPLRVLVHNFTLPAMDKIVALYNHSVFDNPASDKYVTQQMYESQLQDMREHGVNGGLYYGVSESFLSLATGYGLTGFAGYMGSATQEKVNWLSQYGFTPYIYGVDEPHYIRSDIGRNYIPEHLAKSKSIHSVQGKVVTAITQIWADDLNNPAFFPYTDELGVTYTFEEGKLDLPNVSPDASTNEPYFSAWLNGGPKPAHPEVYYWQMYREDPRINRFYAGIHLWLTDLEGVFPYVYQKVINDTYNDFDQGIGNERDLNVTYPSLEGVIDTIEWEAFRAGIDDYRLLRLWKNLYGELLTIDPNKAAARSATLEALLGKYRDTKAHRNLDIATFAADRETLMAEIDGLLREIYPDLTLSVSSPGSVVANSPFIYTIVVNNAGPTTATNVTVIDSLPAGLDFVSVSSDTASCTGTANIICTIGSLAAGEIATIVLTVTPTIITRLTNTISVSANEFDPIPDSNVINTDITVMANTVAVPAMPFWAVVLLVLLLVVIVIFTGRSRDQQNE